LSVAQTGMSNLVRIRETIIAASGLIGARIVSMGAFRVIGGRP
jgi:hypothetical protein